MALFPEAIPYLKLRFLWIALGYALVFTVVYLSITSEPVEMDVEFPGQDKLFHALAYFSLMAWFAQIYHDRFQRNMIAVLFVFMGIALEYIQGMGGVRMFEWLDMLANIVGVLLGILLSLGRGRNILVRVEAALFRRR